MAAKVFYKASVQKDLNRLDKSAARRLLNRIERDLAANPDRGTPLSGEFTGLFRYRAGDYRVIYGKIPDGLLIVRIGHRKEISRSY